MKRLFYTIMLTFISITAYSQSPTKYVNLLPAYPPAIGETQYNNFVYTNSGLYMHDIILDSLPHYEIEHIPDQTVRYFEDGIGFYVKADSLHSSQVIYSYEVDQTPIGPFEFNATTGRFKFYPDAADYMPFTVTFTASSGGSSLTQAVDFNILPEVVPENLAIQSLGEMPSSQDYTILAESHTQMFLNNAYRTVYSYSISGKDIIFDNNVMNKVWGLSGREDLYELNLFAERLYIRSALSFPHANINIYAKELIFEDNGNEIASINTTPSAIETLTYDTGMDGENAGNITLNIKSLKADFAKRFILNGAQGQCAILNNNGGTPGDGGNGGVLIAPIDVERYCDFSRGSAGLKYTSLNGPIIGAGQIGENGHFELVGDKYSWIHPYYIAAVIRHINDSYLNNYFTYSKNTANYYYNLINEFEASDEWDDFDATLKVELQDQTTELEGILYKLNENLDYFGNPLGWVPMLSFEVLLNNYNNEIDRAMPTLYLNYWLQHIDQTMANWVTASQVAASQTQSEIAATNNQINSLVGDIPVLEDKIAVLQNQIEETQNRLEQIKAELLRKAKHNVKKRNRLNKAFGIFKAALNCVPVYGQIASGVVSAVQSVTGFASDYFGVSDTYGYESALTNAFQSITDFDYSAALGNLQQAINSIDLNNLGQTGHALSNCYDNLKSAIGPVYTSITNLHKVLAQSSAPNDQVQAEFDKLCSESAEYQNIKAEIAILQRNYEEFAAILTQTFVDVVNLTSEVSNELVTLDALRGDVFVGNSQRDLQAMQCVEKMKQRAMNRLVKYHYYMRKAYEYRLLRPYQGEFSLETMYNRIEALINQGQIIFDNSTPANFTDYSALSAMFKQEVSGIIEDVIDELTYNAPEQSSSISIVIPREVLDKLNANDEYDLNMFELGLFSPDEENVRIVGFDVQYLEAHTEGNAGMSTYMDIDLVHNGISRFRKNGEVYWFNHISTSTQNPHPNTWSIRYNPLSQETTAISPSFAQQSLLYSILDMNGNATVNNIMLFSRPAAWSDIFMSKKVHTSGNADVVIDSLVLSLQYDFTRRPDAIRNIDIATSGDLLPYITCSEVDRNGRSNGKGSFHRSYNRSSGTVTFTTMETHGNYHFVNWTDRLGNVVSENIALTINKLTDQFYRANYELWIPVISVADTIYVGCEGGEYEVQIQNVGLGDIEMDWFVSDSLSTWVHLNGIAEGINDGFFTFTYEPFSNQGSRIDSLEILAPEIEGMSKTIYIVQSDASSTSGVITAYANPSNGGTVSGAGTYPQGANCTLIATAATGYTFTNWTKDGTQVSTNATYSFTVTESATYVANFTANPLNYTITVSANPSNGGSISGDGIYQQGQTCTLSATPNSGYTFTNWTENGSVVSTNATYSFTVSSNRTLVANFVEQGQIINYWTPVPGIQYNMTVSALVYIDGVEQMSGTLELGAFCGDQCRGAELPIEYEGQYWYFMAILGETGDTITFRLYDHALQQELDLYCTNTLEFVINEDIDPYAVNFMSDVTHTTDFVAGWTWWSTYIEQDGIDGLTMLENGLGVNGDMIKSQYKFTKRRPNGVWMGQLTELQNEEGYMVQVNGDCSVDMVGPIAMPENHPIPIVSGWNWIGYPLSVQQSVGSAMSGFQPSNNDIIKGQSGGFSKYRGGQWIPGTYTLNPGAAYMYYSTATEAKSLTYTQGGSKAGSFSADGHYWSYDVHKFADNISVLAVVSIDGEEQRKPELEIGAFVNGECRGSAKLTYVDMFDRYYAFLSVTGEDGDNVEFGLFDEATGTVNMLSESHIGFVRNDIVGDFETPYPIRFTGSSMQCWVFPNPSERERSFNVIVPDNEEVEEVMLCNALGTIVRREAIIGIPATIRSINVPGVYMVKVVCKSGNVYYSKLIVK